MKAVIVPRFGDAAVLTVAEVETPAVQPGMALVRMAYAGVNYADTYVRSGMYRRGHTYGAEPPFIMGLEGAGTIAALGNEVDGVKAGDRVAFCLHQGAYAEFALVPAWKLVRVPDTLRLEIAAAAALQGATAHYLTHSLRALCAGDWVLVHAAAGGVGRLIVQFAKRCGATVIATVGNETKAAVARDAGADHVILYRDVRFAAEARRLTSGRGVDIVYDGVGAATLAGSLESLAIRGTCVLFGAASGPVEHVTPMALAEAGSVFFTRPHLAHYMRDASEYQARLQEVFAAAAGGTLRVAIDRVLPLEEARAAHEALEARETAGKVLLSAGR